jgi:probable F420-dependent oxidoreductase
MNEQSTSAAGRLGCYVLPGAAPRPREGIEQAVTAERLGLGTAWIGERYDTKDLPSLAGALSQVTTRIRIACGVTHVGTRHPMAMASMGQTLQALSEERFVLGLGRGTNRRWAGYGTTPPTLRSIEDAATILKRLWAGETVSYDGPAGRYPNLKLNQLTDVAPPPLLLAAVGPRTLQLAGRSFDGVILHPFLTVTAVRRSVAIVRRAAVDAGRSPGAVRCYAAVVVAPGLHGEAARRAAGERAAGYLTAPALGSALVSVNGWKLDELERFQQQRSASGDALPPEQWLTDGAALGDVDECRSRLQEYLDAGADDLILHGTVAVELQPLVDAFVASVGS